MSQQEKRKRSLSIFFKIPIMLGILLAVITLLIYFIYWPVGVVLTLFLGVYFPFIFYLYYNNDRLLEKEMFAFATEYESIQNQCLKEFGLPYALLDENGRIIWCNKAFEKEIPTDGAKGRSVSGIYPEIRRELLPVGTREVRIPIHSEGKYYTAIIGRMEAEKLFSDSKLISSIGPHRLLYSMFLTDETASHLALREVDDQSIAAGFIYIDNYEEALEALEDVRRSLLVALIDRKVNRYIAANDGIIGKIEKDKYLFIVRKRALRQMMEAHFELLEDAKTVHVGNEMAITLSIGVGLEGLTYAQTYEFARNAINVALGRGGDQAVVKQPENVTYYGGKSREVEKSTRVKARVKAQALREIIESREQVFIMGHRLGDPDSFGAAVGIYRVARTLGRRAYIIINERTISLRYILRRFEENPEYEEDLIINSAEALSLVQDNAALVVVDTNIPGLTECPEMLLRCKSIVVLDHHRQGKDIIQNTTLSYIEPYASSACEMVSEILQYTGDHIKIRPEEADAIYGGIVVDTSNFTNRTGVRTFEAAAFLRRNGADITRVRKLFRDNVEEYRTKADAVSHAQIYRDNFAISRCIAEKLRSPTVVGAQAANDLLDIRGVKASFVLTPYQGKIFISARSMDEVNVQRIMEKMGGGGHQTVAGCQMENKTLDEAEALLRSTIDTMKKEGEL
ncbi:MAG: DHH family phosphoesterase [Lachnospiraceae bacterium]|nr:DHH family phosphoesterase [Lachnospiraceae bacterium]